MTQEIPVKAVLTSVGQDDCFRLVIPAGLKSRMSLEQLVETVAKDMQLPKALVRGLTDHLIQVVLTNAKNRMRVDFGFADVYLVVKGTVKNANDPVGKDCRAAIAVTPHQAVQNMVRSLQINNESLTPDLAVFECIEHNQTEQYTLQVAGASIAINTKCGLITSGREDEGIWLVDSTGEVVATATIASSDHVTTIFSFATLPEPGTYKLVYACRDGESADTYTPAVRKRNVTVVAAE